MVAELSTWYMGLMERREAESLLGSPSNTVGAFLVRVSRGRLVLSVKEWRGNNTATGNGN